MSRREVECPSALLAAERQIRTVADGIDHPEGVAWYDGALWCGTEAGQLLRVDADSGAVEVVAETGGTLLGIAFDGHGRCVACDARHGRVLRIAPGGEIETLVEAVGGRRLRLPNFALYGHDGTLWVTESGSGWTADDGFLFRLRPGADAERVDDRCHRFPNGLALSADGRTLLVVESRWPGVSRYALDGADVGPRQPLVALPGTVPDGLALDEQGDLYIGCWRPDRVYRHSARAGLEIVVDDPTGEFLTTATNLCFGGSDGTRLFVAGLGGWALRELDVQRRGQPLHHPR